MSEDEIQRLEERIMSELKKLVDLQRQEVIAVRDSVPPTFSDMLTGINKRLDEQKLDMAKHVERHLVVDEIQSKQNNKMNDALARIEPFIKQGEENRKFREQVEETGQKITKWGTRWLIITSVIASIYYGFTHIK